MKKKTKIIATISDRKCDTDFLKSLYKTGMDIVRLNTAHQTPETAIRIIKNVRSFSCNIPFIVDTKGPEVRILNNHDIKVKKDDIVFIDCDCDINDKYNANTFSITYKNYVKDINIGNTILIDDGEIELTVTKKNGNIATCRVENDGIIEQNKSVNTPSVRINLPSLNKKDHSFISFAIENDIDFIAHSFVRNKEDILAIQNILDKHNSKIKIIAKIENQEGVDNIDEILDYAYGIMVARGDLAIEISQNKIPVIQKDIVNKCILRRKPVIVATQMLHTMIKNPRPTRAEVSDIANAIFDGTDAIMLSGETTYGKYPQEAVKVMVDIAKEVENTKHNYNDSAIVLNDDISSFLARSAVVASKELSTKAIIADTASGRTIRNLSAYRGENTIYAMCYEKRIKRELALSYGISAHYIDPVKSSEEFVQKALDKLSDRSILEKCDRVIILAGNFGPAHGASFIEIATVKNLITKN